MILMVADLHLHPHKQLDKIDPETGQSCRLRRGFDVLDWIFKVAYDEDAKAIVFAGDTLHVKHKIDTEVLSELSLLLAMHAPNIPCFFIAGNHEQYGSVTSLDALQHIPGVTVVDVARQEIIDGNVIDMIPFVESKADFDAQVSLLPSFFSNMKYGFNYLITHLSVWGGKPGSSEYVTKEAIHPQCFAKLGYNKVFTGHYHNMQSLNKKGDQTTVERGFVHYLGSPLHQDRSNAEATPVIWLLREDGISFKENKISPRFVKARWGALQRIGNAAGALIRNNYVDVYLGDERPGSEEIKKFMDRFQPAAYEVFIEEKEKESAPIIKGVRANPSNAIKQYVASQRQSKRFTRAGLRFLGRVKE